MSIAKNLIKWQNYAHYLILVIAILIFIRSLFGRITFTQFLMLYGLVFVVDTFVHLIFSLLPGKLRWRD